MSNDIIDNRDQKLVEHIMNPLAKLTAASSGFAVTRVVGIDLGTTNSTVAQVCLPVAAEATAEAACECLSLEQPTQMGPCIGALVPSVVAVDREGEVWVGEGAKRMRAEPQRHGLALEKNLFYETKNDMGLKKRYMRAAGEFDHARKIAGHVLRFLTEGAHGAAGLLASRTVVTVPASFQVNQRADTLEAARMAGLELSEFDLLDEPVAALTDYLFTHAGLDFQDRLQNLVVFDFGGGTCDVFVARISPGGEGSAVSIETRSVSRYHRLGGGDFDAAIIHELLIPQLLEDNKLPRRHFEWAERKKIIEPALRGCAEALKEGLCREIARLHLHGRYAEADKDEIAAFQAPAKVKVAGRDYILKNPRLSAAEWENLLAPYLDPDLLHARESDYTLVLSVFAPITYALERARMKRGEIDVVLLAGGGSLVPQVGWALEAFFSGSRVLRFPDATSAQTAIARGAAWSAAWIETFGKPLVAPVIPETLALRVKDSEPIPLVCAGSPIPQPADGTFARLDGLHLPKVFSGTLRIQMVTLPDERVVLTLPLHFDVSKAGEAVCFEYRFRSSRVFECAVSLWQSTDARHLITAENPLINVCNPGAAREEIERIEEELREAGGPAACHVDMLCRLAELYEEIRMREKACEVLKSALRVSSQPDAWILNRLGSLYGELGDYNRMETHFAEAARVDPKWSAPHFNWALHHQSRREYAKALEKIDEAILRQPDKGPSMILRARILSRMGQSAAARECAEEAMPLFPWPDDIDEWELYWFHEGCVMLGLKEKAELARMGMEGGSQKTADQTTDRDLPELRQR